MARKKADDRTLVTIPLLPEEVAKLDAAAEKLDRTRTWLVRSALRGAIASGNFGRTSGTLRPKKYARA